MHFVILQLHSLCVHSISRAFRCTLFRARSSLHNPVGLDPLGFLMGSLLCSLCYHCRSHFPFATLCFSCEFLTVFAFTVTCLLAYTSCFHCANRAIDDVRYINISAWLRGFQDKPLYLVVLLLYPSPFWELRDKSKLKMKCNFVLKVSEPC